MVRGLRLLKRRRTPWKVLWRSIFAREVERKVGFVVAGTMKGGTSALFRLIRQHPEICPAALKEVRYFDHEWFFRKGANYARYHAWFDPKPEHRLLGEASPSYMYSPKAAQRMWEYNPALKIIIILRDPVERAYSHWNMERRNGTQKASFSAVLEAYRQDPFTGPSGRELGYIGRGRYAEQIEAIWSYFPEEQVLLLRNEDLREDPAEMLAGIFAFLGLPFFASRPSKQPERSEYSGPMEPADRAFLNELYESEVCSLERLLGWNLGHWLKD